MSNTTLCITVKLNRAHLFWPMMVMASACSTNQPDTTPDIKLSESREGLPAEARVTGTSPRRAGDTLICERPRRFRIANRDRWLWVRLLVERKRGSLIDNTIAEAVVSTDPKGQEHAQS